MIRKIAILLHERHRDALSTSYRVWSLAALWRQRGIEVQGVWGIDREVDADLLFPHLDLSYVPDDYWQFIQRHPNVVNRNVRDIRKSTISTNLLRQGDAWKGPVIVKTDRNFRGVVDDQLLSGQPSLARRFLRRFTRSPWIDRASLGWKSSPERYYIFSTIDDVPPRVWKNPALVVERFLPERDGDAYVMRTWTFFGDHGQGRRFYGTDPWIKARNAVMRDIDGPPPPAIMEARQRLGLDYAKMDYVIHDGEPVLLDVSLTPGFRSPTEPSRVPRSTHLADGLAYFDRAV